MRTKRWCAVAVAGLLIAAGCGGDDGGDAATTSTSTTTAGDGTTSTTAGEPTTSTTAGSDTPSADCTATEPGTSLDYVVYAPTASLDPLQSSGSLVGGTELAAIYDVLMRWNEDTQTWEPHAAESLTPNEDNTQWTLTLREGLTYSNGDPVRAQDVVDNIVRLQGPGRQALRALFGVIDLEHTTVPDDLTVVFQLTEPWAAFPYLFADAAGMITNPAVSNELDDAGQSVIGNDPAGAGFGPYTVETWAPGESPFLVLKARPDYWGGAPCIETINFLSIPTDETKIDSLRLGEIDVAFVRSPSIIDENDETGEFGSLLELQSDATVMLINQGVGNFNPITTDVRFRQAVQAALDPELLSQRAFDGHMIEQNGLIHPDSAWYSDGVPEPERGTDVASALVDELKADGWDGKIRLACPNVPIPDWPVAAEAALEAAGMDVDLSIVDTGGVITKVTIDQDYDLACFGNNVTDSTVYRQFEFNLRSTSSSNRLGYASDEMDAALDQLQAAATHEETTAAVAEISRVWAQDIPMAIIAAAEQGIFWRDGVSGIEATQQSVFLFQDARVS